MTYLDRSWCFTCLDCSRFTMMLIWGNLLHFCIEDIGAGGTENWGFICRILCLDCKVIHVLECGLTQSFGDLDLLYLFEFS